MGTQSPAERTLTQIDYVRLTRLASLSARDAYGAIQALLENSDLVSSAAVPATVVTMNTQVRLQGDTGTALRRHMTPNERGARGDKQGDPRAPGHRIAHWTLAP